MLKLIYRDGNDYVLKSLVSHDYSVLIFENISSIANRVYYPINSSLAKTILNARYLRVKHSK